MLKKMLLTLIIASGLLAFLLPIYFESEVKKNHFSPFLLYFLIPLSHGIILLVASFIKIRNIYNKDKDIKQIVIFSCCVILWLFTLLDGNWSKYKRYKCKKYISPKNNSLRRDSSSVSPKGWLTLSLSYDSKGETPSFLEN